MSKLRSLDLPVRLDERPDGCAITGTDNHGVRVHFDDLVSEGDRVATFSDKEGNCYGPFGTVARDEDGELWVIAEARP